MRSGWRERRLGEAITLQRGFDLPANQRRPGAFPVISSSGPFTTNFEAKVKGPGVVTGRYGTVGQVFYVEEDFWPLNTSLFVREFGGNDPLFVSYLLRTLNFAAHDDKSSVPGVNRNQLHEETVLIPPVSEQRAIARTLRTVQQAAEARRREVALEQERKAALVEEAFGQASSGDPSGGRTPTERLYDLGDVSYGLTVNEARRISENTVPYLTVANVSRGSLRLAEVKQIGVFEGDVERYRLQEGDVLLVEGNGNPALLGSAAVWQGELPLALHQNHLIRVRGDQNRILPLWLMHYLNCTRGRAQLLGRGKTSNGLHSINSRIVGALEVPVPPVDIQRAAVELFQACDAKIAALEREIALLDELFRATLEELMTGRLSALPLVDEAAE